LDNASFITYWLATLKGGLQLLHTVCACIWPEWPPCLSTWVHGLGPAFCCPRNRWHT